MNGFAEWEAEREHEGVMAELGDHCVLPCGAAPSFFWFSSFQ
jgi:hypothetical protein